MAGRLRSIVQRWITTNKGVLPLDEGVGSRILLAAAGDQKHRLEQICVMQAGTGNDAKTRAVTQIMAQAVGIDVHPMTKAMAFASFGRSRSLRHQRKGLFWLRTSSALRVPTHTVLGIDTL